MTRQSLQLRVQRREQLSRKRQKTTVEVYCIKIHTYSVTAVNVAGGGGGHGGTFFLVLLAIAVVAFGAWVGYAYFNPQTPSGQCLIRVRNESFGSSNRALIVCSTDHHDGDCRTAMCATLPLCTCRDASSHPFYYFNHRDYHKCNDKTHTATRVLKKTPEN